MESEIPNIIVKVKVRGQRVYAEIGRRSGARTRLVDIYIPGNEPCSILDTMTDAELGKAKEKIEVALARRREVASV